MCSAFPPEIYENVYEVVGWRARAERERRKGGGGGGRKYSRRQRCVLILRNGRLLRGREPRFISRSDRFTTFPLSSPRAWFYFSFLLTNEIDRSVFFPLLHFCQRRFVSLPFQRTIFALLLHGKTSCGERSITVNRWIDFHGSSLAQGRTLANPARFAARRVTGSRVDLPLTRANRSTLRAVRDACEGGRNAARVTHATKIP